MTSIVSIKNLQLMPRFNNWLTNQPINNPRQKHNQLAGEDEKIYTESFATFKEYYYT